MWGKGWGCGTDRWQQNYISDVKKGQGTAYVKLGNFIYGATNFSGELILKESGVRYYQCKLY